MPPRSLYPISSFDPTKAALLHDSLNDKMIPWAGTPDDAKQWAIYARPHGGDDVIAWDGCLIDGWATPLGG
jgi:hypothetical protein